ncbi:MFS transporter [Alishewanella longhuensis]
MGETGKLIWAYGTYTLLMLVYTAINIPYSGLAGVITSDSQRRTTLVRLFDRTGPPVCRCA